MEHSTSFHSTVKAVIRTEFFRKDQIGITRKTSTKFSSDGCLGQNVGGYEKIFPSVESAVTSVHQNGKMHSSAMAANSRYCAVFFIGASASGSAGKAGRCRCRSGKR